MVGALRIIYSKVTCSFANDVKHSRCFSSASLAPDDENGQKLSNNYSHVQKELLKITISPTGERGGIEQTSQKETFL